MRIHTFSKNTLSCVAATRKNVSSDLWHTLEIVSYYLLTLAIPS